MSGLFNPFAEEDNAKDTPTFSFYSDPLASFQPGARGGRGGRHGAGRGPQGPRPPPGPPPPGLPQPQQPPLASTHHQPGPPHGPPPPNPPNSMPSYAGRGRGPGMGPGGWQQGGAPWGQPGPPPMHAQQQGGWPGQQGGGSSYGADSQVAPHKVQRTGPDSRFHGGRGSTGLDHRQHSGGYEGRGGGGGRFGGGRGGRGGRGGGGRGGGWDGNNGGGAPGDMSRYYKPSFSADPWANLLRQTTPPIPHSEPLKSGSSVGAVHSAGLAGGPSGRDAHRDQLGPRQVARDLGGDGAGGSDACAGGRGNDRGVGGSDGSGSVRGTGPSLAEIMQGALDEFEEGS